MILMILILLIKKNMQIIKIPLLIKIYLFFTFMWLLIWIIGLDYLYSFFGFNKFFIVASIAIVLSLFYTVFLLKYFNNPKKYSTINIVFTIFLI